LFGIGAREQIGKEDFLENWRRPVERALKADYSWIERALQEQELQVSP